MTNKKVFEVIIVDLGRTWIFDTIKFTTSEELYDGIDKFRELNNTDEYELQGGNIPDKMTDDIGHLLDLMEEESVDWDTVKAIYDYYNDVIDTENIIKNGCYLVFDGRPSEAIYDYVEESGLLDGVSDVLKNYFDYDSFMRDMEYNGTTIIERYDPVTYNESTIFINY